MTEVVFTLQANSQSTDCSKSQPTLLSHSIDGNNMMESNEEQNNVSTQY